MHADAPVLDPDNGLVDTWLGLPKGNKEPANDLLDVETRTVLSTLQAPSGLSVKYGLKAE